MKRLFLLMTICAMAFVTSSCENVDEQGNTAHLKVTSSTLVEVGAAGDTIAITYQLNNPIEGEAVKTNITTGREFISSITRPATGVILVAIEGNNTSTERSAVVELSYASDNVSIVIIQEAGNGNGNGGDDNTDYDVTFNAYILNGYYYGNRYASQYGQDANRYVIYLSQSGLNNGGQAYPNSIYYYIDAFGPIDAAEDRIADGTYTLDKTNSGKAYTFTAANSQYFVSTETEVNGKLFTDGKMVVVGNNITLDVTVDGNRHHVTFFGSYELIDARDNGGNTTPDDPTGGQDKDAQSTLKDDHVITFPDSPRAKWAYEGDWWKTGYSNYSIMIMNKYNGYVSGDTLQLDIITDNTNNNGDFDGTYNISYNPGKNVAMAGFTDNELRAVGCWYFEYGSGGGNYKNFAMLVKGTVTITNNGDGTSRVVLDAYDCNNHHVTCDWSGEIEKD